MSDLTKTVIFVTLGASSSGKTVACCTTFHQMSAPQFIGKQHFNLIASPPQVRNLVDRYRAIETIGKMPAPTPESRTYSLQFCADDEVMCNVFWIDYQGALLYADEQEEMQSFIQLTEAIQHSAVIVFLFPGDYLNSYIRMKNNNLQNDERYDTEANIRELMNTYKYLLNQIIAEQEEEKNDVKRPVVFCITKSDMIDVTEDRKRMDYFSQLLREYRITGDSQKEGRKVLVCHSTLGRNLDLDMETNTITSIKSIEPEGFEMPMLLTVGYAFSAEGDQWEREEYQRLHAARDTHQNNISLSHSVIYDIERKHDGAFNSIFHFFSKKDDFDRRAALEKDISDAKTKIEEIDNTIKNLQNNNKMKKYAMDILEYIKDKNQEKNHLYVIYIDEHGSEQPLDEFFAQNPDVN